MSHGNPPESYNQAVTIRFEDAEAAEQASVSIAPLYNGHHRAVSCRWDDNWTSDNGPTRDVMEEFGVRGTWYLNDRRFSPQGGDDDYLAVAETLLRGGNSVGGHSLTHPFLTYYHANRMFAETAGCRVVWEAALDRPVTSYAFSFVDIRPEPEDRDVTLRMLETLRRAGYHHIAEYVSFFEDIDLPLELSPILPPENQPLEAFRDAIEWAYDDPGLTERFPMLSNSMHAWYGTGFLDKGYDELRRRFELLTALEDVWHCNQNEYAAYRRQHRHTRVVDASVQGADVTLRVERPLLRALNDPTPLTLSIDGVARSQVRSVACATAEATRSEREPADGALFHLHHDRDQALPAKIGWVANPDNDAGALAPDADGDFPWLRGRLTATDEGLRLIVVNESSTPVTDVHVTWRAPLGWRADAAVQATEPIDAGSRATFASSLQASDSERARIGDAYFIAEVDFRRDGDAGRVFFTCQRAGDAPDASWSRDGFAVLGPLDNESFDRNEFRELVAAGDLPQEWPTPDGSVSWRRGARDGHIHHEWFNPDYVRTMGTWDVHSPTYVVRSKVVAPTERFATLVTSHAADSEVFVNGQPWSEGAIKLNEGENDLVILYPGTTLKPATTRLAACFVRLDDPQTGKRMRDIKYVAD